MNEDKEEGLTERLDEALDRLEDNAESPSAKSPEVVKKPSRSPLGGLGLFVALLAMGIASFAAYTVYEIKQGLAAGPSQHPETIKSFTDIQSITRGLGEQSNKVQQDLVAISQGQDLALEKIKAEIEIMIASINSSKQSSSEDWLIAEAEYLIRLANQHVKMEQDAPGAMALLISADEIVQAAEGIAAFELRASLATDIAALSAVEKLDSDGLFVRLAALMTQVPKLEQRKLKFEAQDPVLVESESEDLSAQVFSFLASIGDRLSGLVDYRRDGDIVTPILPPREDYYLRQNLIMKMQHAQLALLKGKQAVFESSLLDSINWIEQYFDKQNSTSIAMLETLRALQAINIAADMPDITSSLHEVRKLMSRFNPSSAASYQGAIDVSPQPSKENEGGKG